MWSKVFESFLREIAQLQNRRFIVQYTQKQNKKSVEKSAFSTDFYGLSDWI